MLYNLFPVIATAMSAFAFRERPTVHLLLALVVATGGVLLVLGGGTLDASGRPSSRQSRP
jgi:drug/metabolite transporter (DMT)-like permease